MGILTESRVKEIVNEAIRNMAEITTGYGLQTETGPNEQKICIDKEVLVQIIREEMGKRSD